MNIEKIINALENRFPNHEFKITEREDKGIKLHTLLIDGNFSFVEYSEQLDIIPENLIESVQQELINSLLIETDRWFKRMKGVINV